jgi:glycosyltransferase 2 family protein
VNADLWKPPRRVALVSAGLLAGVAAVSLTHQAEARAVWQELTLVPLVWVGAALLLVLCQVACQACRLWAILPQDAALSIARTAYAFSLGEWANIVAPARAGDALKVVLLNRVRGATPLSLAKATGAILADKVVDAGSLVLLCSVTGAASLIAASARARLPSRGVTLAAGVTLTVGLLAARRAPRRWFERVTVLRRELVSGLAALKAPGRLLASIAFSMGAWVAELLALRVLCSVLGFPLSPAQLALALAALNVGISVPVSIANVGVYETVLAFGLSRVGVPLPTAVAIGALHHGLELSATTLSAAGLWLWIAARRQPDGGPQRLPTVSGKG